MWVVMDLQRASFTVLLPYKATLQVVNRLDELISLPLAINARGGRNCSVQIRSIVNTLGLAEGPKEAYMIPQSIDDDSIDASAASITQTVSPCQT